MGQGFETRNPGKTYSRSMIHSGVKNAPDPGSGYATLIKRVFTFIVPVLRIRDVYPGSRILIFTHPGSRIPDPKTATKERGEKKFVVITFHVATYFTKLQIIFVLKC
jgi:hypothetical protein